MNTRKARLERLEKIHHISNHQVIDSDLPADLEFEQFRRDLEGMSMDEVYQLANRLRPAGWGRPNTGRDDHE